MTLAPSIQIKLRRVPTIVSDTLNLQRDTHEPTIKATYAANAAGLGSSCALSRGLSARAAVQPTSHQPRVQGATRPKTQSNPRFQRAAMQ